MNQQTAPALSSPPQASLTFEQLCTRYYPAVLRQARFLMLTPEDAEDLAQEVFEKALQAFPTMRQEHVRAWLYTITRYTALDRIKHQRLLTWQPLPDPLLGQDLEAGVDLQGQVEQHAQVEEVLVKLSPQHRRILLLSIAGYSYGEIAQVVGISADACKNQVCRARRKLQQICTQQGLSRPETMEEMKEKE